MVVVASHQVGQQVGGDDAHLDAMAVGQALAGGGGETLRLGIKFGRQRLAHPLEIGKEVVLTLDEVADPDRRREDFVAGFLAAIERADAGQPAALVPGAPQPDHGVGDARGVLGDLVDLVARDGQVAEHRIGKDLGQIAGVGGVGVGREAADVDVESLRQAQQELGGERPLVALEMVQVAGRDAEILGHARLGEAKLAAQPLEPHPEEQFAILVVRHHRRMSQLDHCDKVKA